MKLFSRASNFESSVQPELQVLYRVAKRLTLDEDDAEDLVQSTLVKAYSAWQSFDGRHLRSWLIRILRNEHFARLRKEANRPEMEDLDPELIDGHCLWDEIVWRDQVAILMEELDCISEEYRLAITLCDIEEMTYEEAGEAMEVPLGTVRSRLARGRSILRRRVAARLAMPEEMA
jgi:RNA polymerase sigma-70 factor, ECF subfamily